MDFRKYPNLPICLGNVFFGTALVIITAYYRHDLLALLFVGFVYANLYWLYLDMEELEKH